ncbi:HAMP domain-containing protein [Fulvimarina endophytica]|uniref:HAMP domain-containing protein n=1 Tax=Fulvimarina endophytica TaxID=2293836 RepID=A0A371WZX6_9HYPH|nr:methyl-accepting chemotaxis protein [Fulvimarina endophytica]RFC62553.1 HAMP domain-containing protein [Fulvimarina endophytica]
MSLRSQIIIPLIVAVLGGVFMSFFIAHQATEAQERAEHFATDAFAGSRLAEEAASHLAAMRGFADQVLAMTTFVPHRTIEARFGELDAAMETVLRALDENELVRRVDAERVAFVEAYTAWRASLGIAVGLAPSLEVPSPELLRRQRAETETSLEAYSNALDAAAATGIATTNQETVAAIRDANILTAVVAGVLLCLGLGLTHLLTGRLKQVTEAMRRLADGDTDISLPKTGRTREIRSMVGALDVFRTNAIERDRLIAETNAANDSERRRYAMEMKALVAGMTASIEAALAGDLSKRIGGDFEARDLKTLAGLADNLLATIDDNLSDVLRVMDGLDRGMLFERVGGDAGGAFGRLREATNGSLDRLSDLIVSIQESSQAVAVVADQLKGGSRQMLARAKSQSRSVDATVTALGQVTETLASAAMEARETRSMVADARRATERSGEIVDDAIAAMTRMEEASGRIGNIVDVIDQIAFQTNLLALNAGVEAARVGDAGKGFAVVAKEVRELAKRSSTAASDVKDLIEDTLGDIKRGAAIVNETGDALARLRTDVMTIDQRIDAVSEIVRAQSDAVNGVNDDVSGIDRLTQENSAIVRETDGSIATMGDCAERLSSFVTHFQLVRATPMSRRAA